MTKAKGLMINFMLMILNSKYLVVIMQSGVLFKLCLSIYLFINCQLNFIILFEGHFHVILICINVCQLHDLII